MTTEASTARHDQIVFAAARLFAVRGYHSTSMDDIAAAVGIRKPTLYHHVTSKAQILLWIHDELATILTSRLRTRIVEGRAPSVILYGVIDDIFDLLESRPGHLGVYFEHHRDIPEPDGAVARARREEYRATVESLIQHGIDLGDFAVESPKLATLAFFGMCNWA
jgi:AcrR family transcriptional regulator